MIVHIARGHIVLEFEGKQVTIRGEAFLPGHGSPDFIVYSNSIHRWDPPNDDEAIDEATKKRILDALIQEMKRRNMIVEIE